MRGYAPAVSDLREILHDPDIHALRLSRDVLITQRCVSFLLASSKRPIVLGLNGPQGSGKSTLAARIVYAMNALGHRAITCSIDDFYVTRAEQQRIADANAGDRTMEHRGYPGTHDVALGCKTLDDLIAGVETRLPQYDKSAHQGRGERAPLSVWPAVTEPLDLVIFEGWMLGFAPVATPPPELRHANEALARYQAWNDRLDAMILQRASTLEDIVHWRVDAERARRERGDPALSEQDARDYIERFLPAYATWTPPLWSDGVRSKGNVIPVCVAQTLGRDRLPIIP